MAKTLFVILLSFLLYNCGKVTKVIRIDHKQYQPTDTVLIIVKPDSYITSFLTSYKKLLVNQDTLKAEYYEIGSVEASSSVSYNFVIDKMIKEAKNHGAQALINIETYESGYSNSNQDWKETPTVRALMIRFK